jgi:hypothetical protein
MKEDEAFNKNDAAALAALFTEDAVYVVPEGLFCGRQAIEKRYADVFQRRHPIPTGPREESQAAGKEPWLVRVFAERLRSKLAMERSAAGCSDDEREWYIILTLWPPLQMIRLLEDSSQRADRLRPEFSICLFVVGSRLEVERKEIWLTKRVRTARVIPWVPPRTLKASISQSSPMTPRE